jgi:1-acyl-sn-glycerol-3-phosphate acyltransferase
LIFVTRRKTFFMAKDSLWKVPVLGTLLTTMGAFKVHRGAADREAMNHAERVLEQGQALVLFPEGTRKDGHTVEDLHDGAMFIAARQGAVVVPVGIGGTERALPKGAKFPRITKTSVVVGNPIQAPRSEGRVSRSQLAEATKQLQAGLQEAYDAARGLL